MEQKYYMDEVAEFQVAVNDYIAGKIDKPTVKHATAKFGIYRQNDDSFMVRVRITGGNLLMSQLKVLAEIAKAYKCNFFHLSTRQTIQIQGIPVTSVNAVVDQMIKSGLIFRGGGGNTYRNIACSPETTFASDAVFDVLPYVKQVQDYVFQCDKAYKLPRKLKISISCSDEDSAMATMQDLGFIATLRDGKRGFKVYIGGGMGRDSKIALQVIEFLPVDQLLKVVKAMVDLFHEHGNREKRHLARLRHLRTALGDEAFVTLFEEYLAKVDVNLEVISEKFESSAFNLIASNIDISSDDYKLWVTRAVMKNGVHSDESAVDLFLPFGNLSPEQFIEFAKFFEASGISNIVLTTAQNFILPRVKNESLPALYHFIKSFSVDLSGASFKGLMQACIGSQVCTLGLVDTPKIAEEAAAALDEFYAGRRNEQAQLCKTIIHGIRFSGCQNSCGAHVVAGLGFQGMVRTDANGVKKAKFAVFHGGSVSASGTTLAKREGGFIDADQASKEIINFVK